MYVLFGILVAPLIFFLLMWGAATTYRIYFPEQPLPFEKDAFVRRRKATAAGQHVPVGLREIREDQRRSQRARARGAYCYDGGYVSAGVPSTWLDDLRQRRN